MAKADKSDTSTEEEKAVEAKISDDVVDAEIIDENVEDVEASEEESTEEMTAEDQPEDITPAADDARPEEMGSEVSSSDIDQEGEIQSGEPSEETQVEQTAGTTEPETEATSVEAPAVAEVSAKKTGFVQVVLGGVIAAALGFGVSQYVGPLAAEKDPDLVALEALVEAQSEKIDALLTGQSATQSNLEAAQKSVASTVSNVEGLTGAVAAVNARIDDASGALAKLDGRLAALEKNPITQNLPSAAIEAYEREVEELKASVAEQRAEAATMEENAKLTAQQALARAALSRVLSALDSGASYRAALTDFSVATGTATPDALEAFADTGVMSLAALQSDFPASARKALAVARTGEQTEGNKLSAFFKAQLGARSVTPKDGDNADAVLSRAEAALQAGRVTDTLAELATLPDAAKTEFSGWVAQAEARQAAFVAGEALSQQLNAN